MIFKKPYGLLKKYFKLIHLILLVPMIYVLFEYGDISRFFKSYVAAGYVSHETNIADNYITAITYIIVLILIIVNAVIMSLLDYKKKKSSLIKII